MLDFWESLLVVCAVALLAVSILLLLNRIWPRENRRVHNDMVGWQLSIVGTIYAVILGFMLYTVWNSYTAADLNVDLEANSVETLYRLSAGLPGEQSRELRLESSEYATAVVQRDWPEMSRGELPDGSVAVASRMWSTLMSVKSATSAEATAVDHALSMLSTLNQYRRNRILQSNARLPTVLWWVLIAGAVMTIGSACLFGGSSSLLHSLQVSSLAVLVALVLVAVADINRPFQGGVHVSSFAFERAITNMQER